MSEIIDSTKRSEIARSLANKEYREAFVEAEINTTIPFQIRTLRLLREWSQTELANRTGQKQKTISDFENPSYGRLTLSSLKRLAAAFDVALVVRFAPFSELVDWTATMSKERMEVPSFDKDDFSERADAAQDAAFHTIFVSHVGSDHAVIAEVVQTFATTLTPGQTTSLTLPVTKTMVSDSPFGWMERTGT